MPNIYEGLIWVSIDVSLLACVSLTKEVQYNPWHLDRLIAKLQLWPDGAALIEQVCAPDPRHLHLLPIPNSGPYNNSIHGEG